MYIRWKIIKDDASWTTLGFVHFVRFQNVFNPSCAKKLIELYIGVQIPQQS